MTKPSSVVTFEYEYTGKERVPKDVNSVKFHPNVTEVEDGAFKDCLYLKNIVLNEGLLKIGNHSFQGCTLLQSINLPATLKHIGVCAFQSCTCLVEVVFNDRLNKIGENASGAAHHWKKLFFPTLSLRLLIVHLYIVKT